MDIYRNLAVGGAGLIITGFMTVLLKYRTPGRAMRLDTDDFITGVKQIADVVRKHGDGARVMAQIHLPGRQWCIMRLEIGPPRRRALPVTLLRAQVPEDLVDHLMIDDEASSLMRTQGTKKMHVS